MIDVYAPKQKHIYKTDLILPYYEINNNKDKLPENMKSKIMLYCGSGRMSRKAAKILTAMGYENIYYLKGGTRAWKRAGYIFE